MDKCGSAPARAHGGNSPSLSLGGRRTYCIAKAKASMQRTCKLLYIYTLHWIFCKHALIFTRMNMQNRENKMKMI